MNGGQVNVTYKLDPAEWQALVLKLNELAGPKARTHIARALNKTAVSARLKLGRKAQESYTVKMGGFRKDMQIEKATSGNLVATIQSHGKPLSIPKFKYTFSRPNPTKVDIVKSGLKPLSKYGNKSFLGEGRIAGNVYVRTDKPAKRYKGMPVSRYKARTGRTVKREGLEKLMGKSVPYMLGSDNRVYGPLRPQIQADLSKFMNQQIKMLLG